MEVAPEIAVAAEDLLLHVRWMSGLRRERLGGVHLCLMPGDDPRLAKVMKVRVRSGEVDRVVAAVRAKLRAEGRTTSTWWLGPSTTPPDLAQRLIGHGLVPIDPTTAMVATAAPVAAVNGVEVRPVRTRKDADAAAAIVAAAFEMNPATTRALAAAIREEIDPPIPDSIMSFLAVINGVAVGTAASAGQPIPAAATQR